jgi:hypothetical protein
VNRLMPQTHKKCSSCGRLNFGTVEELKQCSYCGNHFLAPVPATYVPTKEEVMARGYDSDAAESIVKREQQRADAIGRGELKDEAEMEAGAMKRTMDWLDAPKSTHEEMVGEGLAQELNSGPEAPAIKVPPIKNKK